METQPTHSELRGDHNEFHDMLSDWSHDKEKGEDFDDIPLGNSDPHMSSVDKTHHGIQPYADRGEPALTFPASIQSNVDGAMFLSISRNGDQSQSNLEAPKSDLWEPESDPEEPESTLLPPTTVDNPTGEQNRETTVCSNVGHVWSLLSLDFLKKRQVKHKISLDFLKKRHVKYKMFKHLFAPPRLLTLPWLCSCRPRYICTTISTPQHVEGQGRTMRMLTLRLLRSPILRGCEFECPSVNQGDYTQHSYQGRRWLGPTYGQGSERGNR